MKRQEFSSIADFRGHASQQNIKELSLFISELKSLGIDFLKDKNVTEDHSHVVYKKYIKFEKLEDGVFHDHHNENRYFFSAPNMLEFDQFTTAMDQRRSLILLEYTPIIVIKTGLRISSWRSAADFKRVVQLTK